MSVPTSPNGHSREPARDDPGRVDPARKASTQAAEALRVLLRGRLRRASLLVTAVFVVMGCLAVLNILLNPDTIAPRVRQGLAFFAGPAAAWVALTALLWSRRPLSLAQLRAAELVLVGNF